MIACSRCRRRAWVALAVLAVAALAGGAVWVILDPPWSAGDAGSAAEQPAALTVNGEPVTYRDLAIATRRAETTYRSSGAGSTTTFEGASGAFVRLALAHEAMQSLVRQSLILQEARARKLEVADKRVEEETQQALTQLVEQARGSGTDLPALLVDVGQNLEGFTAELREETRVRLLSDAVTLAVIGLVKPTDEELQAFYEARKATYSDDYAKVRDRVRSDYNRNEVSLRRETWITAQLAKARVQILDPVLAAFDRVRKGDAAGLADLERLRTAKTWYDPYLAYYIARIHHDTAVAAFAERQSLEKTLGATPTKEQTDRVQFLRTQEKESTAKAVAAYVDTLTTAPADADLVRRILQLNPAPAVRSLAMGLTAWLGGDAATARARLEESLRLDATLSLASLALGEIAARAGDAAQALARTQDAASRAPRDPDVLLTVSDALLSIGRLAEAEAQVKAARALAPNYARLWAAEGDLALRRLKDAADERDRLQALATRTATEEARHGILAASVRQLAETARVAYERVAERRPSEDVLVKLGNALLLVGEEEEALGLFREALQRSAHAPEAHVGLGDVLAAQGDASTALAHYAAALSQVRGAAQQAAILPRMLRINPTDGATRLTYGITLTRLGRWEEAIAQLSPVLDAQPDLIQAHLWIAESYAALGDYATAIGHLKTGIGPTATPAAKDSATAQIVALVKRQLSAGLTPATDVLDTLLQVARSRLGSGYPGDTVEALALLASIDPTYRQAEVTRLLEAAKNANATQDAID